VTPLGRGDPDLFVSTTVERPTRTNHTWAAQRFRGDSITIPHTDPNSVALRYYYIGVFAYTNTTFSIVASLASSVALQNGIPQSGAVSRGAMRYYTMQVLGGTKDLTVSVQNMFGQAELYISTTMDPEIGDADSYQWHVPWWFNSKSITISEETDERACHSVWCYYYIGVYGISNSSFSIVASTADATIPLRNGIPQRDHVETGEYEYFSVRVENDGGLDLSVMVTPVNGDPDIYMSRNTSRPTELDYEKKSTRFGADVVDYENAERGTYYIGVKAFSNSTFSIVALLTDASGSDTQNTIQLYDGQAQSGSLHHTHFRYYTFTLTGSHSELTFALTKVYGDPDLYVKSFPVGEDPVFPTTTDYDFSSTSSQNDVVAIQHPASGRVYMVGVYAYSTCAYSLTGTSSSGIVELQAGAPQQGSLQAHQFDYYRIFVYSWRKDLTISVTPFSGDPDLYISVGSTTHQPNRTTYDWAATSYRGDSITIPHTDARMCFWCNLYIGVYSFTASAYTLTASFQTPTHLEDGVPTIGSVNKHAFTHYILRVQGDAAHSDITLVVTPRNGVPNLFVSTTEEPTLAPSTYQWRTHSFSQRATLVLHSSDAHFCTAAQCTYYIGVYGTRASNYTLIASTSAATTSLQDGVPVQEWVPQGGWEYFMIHVPTQGADLLFALTPLSGDPDLYVSFDPRPNSTNSIQTSRAPGADAVTIHNATTTKVYYVGVQAFTNSTFTLTAYIRDPSHPGASTWLVDGIPQTGVVAQDSFAYYRMLLTDSSKDLTISVSRIVGDPDIYVSMWVFPTRDSYGWRKSQFGGTYSL
jgi:hypothetical protein